MDKKFQFQTNHTYDRNKVVTVTVRLEGKLAMDFDAFYAKCEQFCKVSRTEVARQMIQFACAHIDQDVPLDVTDPVEDKKSPPKDSFSLSTQPQN